MAYLCHRLYIDINFLIFTDVHCDIQFQHDTEQCLGQLVEYQCIMPIETEILAWTVNNDDGRPLSLPVAFPNSTLASSYTLEEFLFEHLSTSPIVSNISFTVQSSINGYTIVCENYRAKINENFTINIPGIIIIIAYT